MKGTTRRALLSAGGALAIGSVAIADQKASSTNATQEDERESMPEDTDPKNLVRAVHLAPDVGEIEVGANGARGFDPIAPLNESEYETYQPNSDYDITILEGD